MLPQKTTGDRISLADYNAIRDHINTLTPVPPEQTHARHECVITIENTTGTDLDAFDVVQLTGPIFDREDEDFQLKAYQFGVEMQCAIPVDDSPCHVAVLLDAVPEGKIGHAFVSGAVACRIDSGSGSSASETVLYAVPTPGETYLTAAPSGIRVLCRNSGEGIQWGYVLLPACCGGEDEELFACLEESLTDGGSASAKIWPDFSETLTVHASPLLCPGESVDACTMVHARWFSRYGKWYVVTVGGTCHCDCSGGSDSGSDSSGGSGGGDSGGGGSDDSSGGSDSGLDGSDSSGDSGGDSGGDWFVQIWYAVYQDGGKTVVEFHGCSDSSEIDIMNAHYDSPVYYTTISQGSYAAYEYEQAMLDYYTAHESEIIAFAESIIGAGNQGVLDAYTSAWSSSPISVLHQEFPR